MSSKARPDSRELNIFSTWLTVNVKIIRLHWLFCVQNWNMNFYEEYFWQESSDKFASFLGWISNILVVWRTHTFSCVRSGLCLCLLWKFLKRQNILPYETVLTLEYEIKVVRLISIISLCVQTGPLSRWLVWICVAVLESSLELSGHAPLPAPGRCSQGVISLIIYGSQLEDWLALFLPHFTPALPGLGKC